MTMQCTMGRMTNDNPTRTDLTTDLTTDTQTMPPFVAAEKLEDEISRLDQWVSNFIGRLQPYCAVSPSDQYPVSVEAMAAPPNTSPLEDRLYRLRDKVMEITTNLDSMNQSLHL